MINYKTLILLLTPQADRFIRPSWGRGTFERLQSSGVDVDFVSVPGLQHEMNSKETWKKMLVSNGYSCLVMVNGYYLRFLVFGIFSD